MISGKNYIDKAEDSRRKQNFKNTRDQIKAHNDLYEKGLTTYTMGINQFADKVRRNTKTLSFPILSDCSVLSALPSTIASFSKIDYIRFTSVVVSCNPTLNDLILPLAPPEMFLCRFLISTFSFHCGKSRSCWLSLNCMSELRSLLDDNRAFRRILSHFLSPKSNKCFEYYYSAINWWTLLVY